MGLTVPRMLNESSSKHGGDRVADEKDGQSHKEKTKNHYPLALSNVEVDNCEATLTRGGGPAVEKGEVKNNTDVYRYRFL